MNKNYVHELQVLACGLIERGIPFQFKYMPYLNGGQIVADGWDAICHDGSYGREEGLLEIMGVLVNKSRSDDSIEGYLTAMEILDRIDRKRG